MLTQKIFNPVDYYFEWTDDGWYEWDRRAAHTMALKDRNKKVRELRGKGHKVSVFSLSGQLITKGGIGTGKPQVEFVVNCYGYNMWGK
jgi:hypothetical protein